MGVPVPQVTVSSRGLRRWRSGHPWIFREDVKDAAGASHGALVRVAAPTGFELGFAAYSARSKITLRMVAPAGEPPDDAYWSGRLADAVRYRRRWLPPELDAFRIVHGESDGLPGLVADLYARHLVVQSLTAFAERHLEPWSAALAEQTGAVSVLARNDPSMRALEGLPREVRQIRGATPEIVEIHEGGLRIPVDPHGGQKTGAFLDQRENRAAAARLVRGRVLDAFCYQGGFALHASGAAESVIGIDSSEPALERARAAAELNGLGNVAFRRANVFGELKRLVLEGQTFDAVLLDPPAFAKRRSDLPAAERAYKEVNLRAMRLLSAGGILMTSSCSYNLSEGRFLQVLTASAQDARRSIRVLERRTQSLDHPVLLGFPESHYLKCLVLSVS